VLAAQEVFGIHELRRTVLLGELDLDGRLRRCAASCLRLWPRNRPGSRGSLSCRGQRARRHWSGAWISFGLASITQLVAFLRGIPMPPVEPVEVMGERAGKDANRRLDMADVVAQVDAKWGCEVAAAGRHHMLFHGSPGVGKTMPAERVPGLLRDLDVQDALEVSAVHSLAGFNLADELITRPPYSDPHYSASVGGETAERVAGMRQHQWNEYTWGMPIWANRSPLDAPINLRCAPGMTSKRRCNPSGGSRPGQRARRRSAARPEHPDSLVVTGSRNRRPAAHGSRPLSGPNRIAATP
jgi:hypothetical protein